MNFPICVSNNFWNENQIFFGGGDPLGPPRKNATVTGKNQKKNLDETPNLNIII